MGWYLYILLMLVVAGLAGRQVGRFRASSTGMTGMMAGMTMGMMSGFVLGYGAAATTNSMFWGNLFGLLIGLALGVFYGRSGGLMGLMDGGMGGIMGGSMGAMLAVMVRYSVEAQLATAALLTVVFLLAIAALIVLVQQAAPDQRELPPLVARLLGLDDAPESARPLARGWLTDYYDLLNVAPDADHDEIYRAYFVALDNAPAALVVRLEKMLSVLTDPAKRAAYDRLLAQQQAQQEEERATETNEATEAEPGEADPKGGGWRRVAATVIGLVLLVDLLLWLMGGGLTGRNVGDLDMVAITRAAVAAPRAADGRQTLDLTVNGDTMAYNIVSVTVKRGQPVRFNLRIVGKDPDCGRVVMIPGLGASGVALPGRTTTMDFTPDTSGTYRINCPMLMMKSAYLLVSD